MNEIDLVGLAIMESFVMLKKKKSLPTYNNVKVVATLLCHFALCVCSRPKSGMLSRAKKGCEVLVLILILVALLPLLASTCHLNLLIEPGKLMPEYN